MEFDLENPLKSLVELNFDALPSLFQAESDHMPTENYIRNLMSEVSDFNFRREVISIILQVHRYSLPLSFNVMVDMKVLFMLHSERDFSCLFQFNYDFEPVLCYLAINYLDRFLSSKGMPVKRLKFRAFDLIPL